MADDLSESDMGMCDRMLHEAIRDLLDVHRLRPDLVALRVLKCAATLLYADDHEVASAVIRSIADDIDRGGYWHATASIHDPKPEVH